MKDPKFQGAFYEALEPEKVKGAPPPGHLISIESYHAPSAKSHSGDLAQSETDLHGRLVLHGAPIYDFAREAFYLEPIDTLQGRRCFLDAVGNRLAERLV